MSEGQSHGRFLIRPLHALGHTDLTCSLVLEPLKLQRLEATNGEMEVRVLEAAVDEIERT